jgi:hypothetical protein
MTEEKIFKIIVPFLYFGMCYLYASAIVLFILDLHYFLCLCLALMGACVMVGLHYINEYRKDNF